MARRVDVLTCKPEELFLAVSQVEQQLAETFLLTKGGRHKIPIQVLLMMSELKVPETDSEGRLIIPPEGTTLLSCDMAHWKACGILTQFLPTFSRFAYTLPDDAEMFMCGVLIDVYSQRWKAYLQDLSAFPQPLIEPAQ